MKTKIYLITNRGSSTISVVGRRAFTIPKDCKDMEIAVPDTKEMKQRMARLKRKYPALKIVEVAEPAEEQKATADEPTEAEPAEEQKAAAIKKNKGKAKTEAVETPVVETPMGAVSAEEAPENDGKAVVSEGA